MKVQTCFRKCFLGAFLPHKDSMALFKQASSDLIRIVLIVTGRPTGCQEQVVHSLIWIGTSVSNQLSVILLVLVCNLQAPPPCCWHLQGPIDSSSPCQPSCHHLFLLEQHQTISIPLILGEIYVARPDGWDICPNQGEQDILHSVLYVGGRMEDICSNQREQDILHSELMLAGRILAFAAKTAGYCRVWELGECQTSKPQLVMILMNEEKLQIE